ncbi:MAG: polysaccharide biosynthesis/export family protein [Rickettsiales bacterium]|nr:polysaccharide biosynthesis/export family protein [Rickettsiales bacterium]
MLIRSMMAGKLVDTITTCGSSAGRCGGLLLITSFMLSGCGAVPADGPSASSVAEAAGERITGSRDGKSDGNLPFVFIDANDENVDIVSQANGDGYFKEEFTDRRDAADIRIGLGDTIRVTIFEAGSGGLFVPASGSLSSGNFVSIPDQEVDRTGSVTVPYAAKGKDGGVVKVYGRRPIEVQADIEKRLADRAIEPQVVVTIVSRTSNLYSVIGDVNGSGRFNVPQGGIRILDAIGMAGGLSGTDYETLVTLQREGKSVTARILSLLKRPQNNIFVRPNDIISLKKEELYYNVLGAVTESGRVALSEEKVMLADAIARAGGLDIERAEASSVLIYREEKKEVLQGIGAQIESPQLAQRETIPTVYRVNLRDPKGVFIARKLQLHHNDMIYVDNHPIVGTSRILSIVRDLLVVRVIDG